MNILTPCFNDWQSLEYLIADFEKVSKKLNIPFSIYVVNDGSTIPMEFDPAKFETQVNIIHLNLNVGHQKAISIGICYLSQQEEKLDTIIMDSDGEDKPEDVEYLIEYAKQQPETVIFAQRKKRSEGIIFRTFYIVYKQIFKVLTGKHIGFGNFSLIPFSKLNNLANLSEIWNHYSGAVVKSRVQYDYVSVDRGKRYKGESKMNFISLVLHGISAISVHVESVLVRLVVFSTFLFFALLVLVFVSLIMKFIFHLTSPGWTTTIIFGSLSLIFQLVFTSLLLCFQVLTIKNQPAANPLENFKRYIKTVDKF